MKPMLVRASGAAVALGGIVWSTAWLISPSSREHNSQVEIWGGGVFQLGLLLLMGTMWATYATGTGRWSRGIVAAEGVALILACAWTVPYLFDANRPSSGVLMVLDAFWPLSMAGLIVVGFLVARARRWPAPTRYLPMAASLLIPVDIAIGWAPDDVRTAVTTTYLALAYTLLGAMMIRDAAAIAADASTETSATEPAAV